MEQPERESSAVKSIKLFMCALCWFFVGKISTDSDIPGKLSSILSDWVINGDWGPLCCIEKQIKEELKQFVEESKIH